jgi:hypothetical protein
MMLGIYRTMVRIRTFEELAPPSSSGSTEMLGMERFTAPSGTSKRGCFAN